MARWGAFLMGLLSMSSHKEQCCDDGVCFMNEAPFDDLPLPKCPEEIGPTLKLYSRDNKYRPELLHPDSLPDAFNATRRTIFLIHGYMHELTDMMRNPDWDKRFKNKLLDRDDVNVVLVDWSRGSQNLLYPMSASNTRAVGVQVARVVQTLVELGGSSREQMWCIGFSLGAHVCGHAGHRYKIGKITGLDPAGPWFEDKDTSIGLNPSCADFVDVWHTHGERGLLFHFGTLKPLGHVDFFPNGGGQQPGCRVRDLFTRRRKPRGLFSSLSSLSRLPSLTRLPKLPLIPHTNTDLLPDCSHMRVLTLFEEALDNSECGFAVAMKCQDHTNIQNSCVQCNQTEQRMGMDAEHFPGRGLYWLETNPRSPFCKQIDL